MNTQSPKTILTAPFAVAILLFAATAPSFAAVQLVPLISFDGTNGANPSCTLVQGSNGNYYGTTYTGSTSEVGSVFSISLAGRVGLVAPLYFTGSGYSRTGLILGTDGNFYGTATEGTNGGTVFRMDPNGNFTVLVQFGTNGSPNGLLQGIDGNFYGTTDGDTVFKMTPDGTLTTIFAFDGTNGSTVESLVQGNDGNLYGTTYFGGTYGAGTVFQITTNGAFTTLWSCDSTNGDLPESVIQGKDGNLYGSAYGGGSNYDGTLFKLTTNGDLTLLHTFSQRSAFGENADGANPVGLLMQASDGCIYGGTQYGGTNLFINHGEGGIGTLFKITANGDFTTLCSFGDYTNFYKLAAFPNGLIQDQKGNFFGTTYYGGIYDVGNRGLGTVFKLVTPILVTPKPILTITSHHVSSSNAVATVNGKAKEKGGAITNVLWQSNNGGWTPATIANNWTNWTVTVPLALGTNIFQAYAVDANGDTSRTNTLKLRSR
jgi:uncharacterized repeat protein (TIGR03803 family)